ncbi:MAG: diguanylate cyclase, partial [Pseudomonadota bacterium]
MRDLVQGALIVLFGLIVQATGVAALEIIEVKPTSRVIELTERADLYSQRADSLPVETAPNADGAVGRMVVRSVTPGTNPNWAVFALQNTSRQPIERWITAERYRLIGSRIVFPDLDSARLSRLTPSIGFVPERVPNDDADIFRITLPPNQTTTFVVELASERFPRMQLWEPRAYQAEKTDAALFNGVMLGAVTLLSLFLTAVFAANQRLMFPLAAFLTWAVTSYMCVDFGYWHRLFRVDPGDLAFYRAGAEAAIALGLVGFLFAFLRISHWHTWLRALYGLWLLAQVGILALALLDPKLGVTFARLSFLLIAGIGSLTVAYLALRGQDRALALVPPWLFLLVWIFGMAAALNGRLNSELVAPSLMAGLTLIMVMLGYTVAQFAFGGGAQRQDAVSNARDGEARAIDAAQVGYWEWNARRDEIKTGQSVENTLELHEGELSTRASDWLAHVHPGDRDKFRVMLAGLEDQQGGRAELALRLRKADNTYRWFELKAGTFQDQTSRSLKAVGLMRDITDERRGRDRLLHDAVHDHLTGLPNRELFMDRLGTALLTDADVQAGRPTVLLIDIDRFKNINSSFGLVVGDSMLLTAARRLTRHLRPGDTLARIAGDQFAVLLRHTIELREVALLAERCRRSLRAPMTLAGQEIVLTCSIGATRYDGTQSEAADLLREAENALYRA